MEFLVQIEAHIPPELPPKERAGLVLSELQRGRQLKNSGVISAIWAVSGGLRNAGIWSAADRAELDAILESLPLAPWLTKSITPLEPLDFDALISTLTAQT